MRFSFRLTLPALWAIALYAQPLLIRGIHLSAPRPEEIPLAVRFIREALPREGVNTLVLEFNYRYQFQKRPEMAEENALSRDDVQKLAAAARDAGVRLIPQMNMLGHQSGGKRTGKLLTAHPEFDETPGRYPGNEGIYCRSYCPLHPQVHEVLFDLMDELADACGADAFHVGMDEVFLLGEDDCERCKGKSKADLFAQEVRTLHDHLAATKRTMWMWGDRFLDGDLTGTGRWEGSQNNTYGAIQSVPKDIMICDWHYDTAHPTAALFALAGFQVVYSPWRRTSVALRELDLVRALRANSSPQVGARMAGMLQTTWSGFGTFVKGYFNEDTSNARAMESVNCFRELFRELRKQQ